MTRTIRAKFKRVRDYVRAQEKTRLVKITNHPDYGFCIMAFGHLPYNAQMRRGWYRVGYVHDLMREAGV